MRALLLSAIARCPTLPGTHISELFIPVLDQERSREIQSEARTFFLLYTSLINLGSMPCGSSADSEMCVGVYPDGSGVVLPFTATTDEDTLTTPGEAKISLHQSKQEMLLVWV